MLSTPVSRNCFRRENKCLRRTFVTKCCRKKGEFHRTVENSLSTHPHARLRDFTNFVTVAFFWHSILQKARLILALSRMHRMTLISVSFFFLKLQTIFCSFIRWRSSMWLRKKLPRYSRLKTNGLAGHLKTNRQKYSKICLQPVLHAVARVQFWLCPIVNCFDDQFYQILPKPFSCESLQPALIHWTQKVPCLPNLFFKWMDNSIFMLPFIKMMTIDFN